MNGLFSIVLPKSLYQIDLWVSDIGGLMSNVFRNLNPNAATQRQFGRLSSAAIKHSLMMLGFGTHLYIHIGDGINI
jgi:hypothetical protein